jgi:hypothetical protein
VAAVEALLGLVTDGLARGELGSGVGACGFEGLVRCGVHETSVMIRRR